VEQKNIIKDYSEVALKVATSSIPIKSEIPLEQNLDFNVDNKPKKIIGDLTVRLLEVLPEKLDKNNLLKIVALFEENLAAKNILFYFNDENLQAEIIARNWGGEVKDTPGDYLMVVNTNIAGQKSDRKIEEIINHKSLISPDGSIINTVSITRTHTGLKNEVFTGVRNVDWLRIYVPLGSELISATGFISPEDEYLQDQPEPYWQEHEGLQAENMAKKEPNSQTLIYEENNKTVFANWLMVDPGEEQIVVLKYRLPFNFYQAEPLVGLWDKFNQTLNPEQGQLHPYSLLVQKQAGAKPSFFSSHLSWKEGYRAPWSYPKNIIVANGWFISEALEADKYYSILIEKDNN
jgi:hypothetical protein